MPVCRSSEVRANTVYTSDTLALVIHVLDPVMIQSSPSRIARVVIDATSLPASASDSA